MENYETLLKDINYMNDKNKWRDIPCLQIGRLI